MLTLFVKVTQKSVDMVSQKNMRKCFFKNLINLKKKAQGIIHFRDYKVLSLKMICMVCVNIR